VGKSSSSQTLSVYNNNFTKRPPRQTGFQKSPSLLIQSPHHGPGGAKPPRTLLFDLDETLIHCVEDNSDPSSYEHLIEIKVTEPRSMKAH